MYINVKFVERSDGMLRQKLSIVLAPKVVDDANNIAAANSIKTTEFFTRLIEEMFRNKKQLAETLANIGIDAGDMCDRQETIKLPFETKQAVIPDKCPACGESEDILGDKVLYLQGNDVCCKACYNKFKAEMR